MTGRAVPSPKAVGKPGGFDAGRADRRRLFKGYASAALGILAVCTGLHGLARSDLPLGLLFSFGGAGLALYAVGRFVLYRRLRKAGDLWRQVDGGVEFGPASYPIWDYLSVAVTTIGALAPMAVILLAGSSYPRAFRVFLVAAELLLLCIAMGALLLPVGETSVTLSAPPPLYTDLQRIVEFYANCPEASSELATEAGLARVRALSSRL